MKKEHRNTDRYDKDINLTLLEIGRFIKGILNMYIYQIPVEMARRYIKDISEKQIYQIPVAIVRRFFKEDVSNRRGKGVSSNRKELARKEPVFSF